MRLTTDFWVSALIRRTFDTGGFAAVERRGAAEAGAVFVTVRDRFGGVALYGPAPQASYDDKRPLDRLFTPLLGGAEASEIERRLAREQKFDPDMWVVDIEPGQIPIEELLDLAKP